MHRLNETMLFDLAMIIIACFTFYGPLLHYREQKNLQQFKSIKIEIGKNRVNIKQECVN